MNQNSNISWRLKRTTEILIRQQYLFHLFLLSKTFAPKDSLQIYDVTYLTFHRWHNLAFHYSLSISVKRVDKYNTSRRSAMTDRASPLDLRRNYQTAINLAECGEQITAIAFPRYPGNRRVQEPGRCLGATAITRAGSELALCKLEVTC